MTRLAPAEFATDTTYLNTAAYGLPAARTLTTLRTVLDDWAAGRRVPSAYDDQVDELRASFARLLPGAEAEDVAVGSTVAALIGPAAAGLPSGAEVLVAEGDFASVPNPFRYRGDLRVRTVPLDQLATAVRPETALVAVSLVQSADGRTIDPTELRAATRAHDARLLIDASQAAGWLPLRFDDADYWVCATFKWLLGARSVSLLAVAPDAAETLRPTAPGWYAAADRYGEMYAPRQLASTARRFDDTPDWLGVVAARSGLELIGEVGIPTIHAHNLALAARFRSGLADLGVPVGPGDSPIVSLPGAGDLAEQLADAGIAVSGRAGALRVSFHLYNDTDDVDHILKTFAQR